MKTDIGTIQEDLHRVDRRVARSSELTRAQRLRLRNALSDATVILYEIIAHLDRGEGDEEWA